MGRSICLTEFCGKAYDLGCPRPRFVDATLSYAIPPRRPKARPAGSRPSRQKTVKRFFLEDRRRQVRPTPRR